MTFRWILSALVVAYPASLLPGQTRPTADLIKVEVATVGIGLVSRNPVVVLHDPVSEKTMPVWVGPAEAQAIARSLFGVKSTRPMTHDLLADVITALGGKVEEFIVNDSRDGVYYGRLHVRARDKSLADIDTRPSDAVALALRTGAPIRVKRQLLEEAPEIQVMPDDETPDFARALGLTVMSPNADVRKLFGLPARDGVVVAEAVGEAGEAGLKRGDLIVEVNGKTPKDAQAFWDAVRAGRAGGPLRLRFWRDGKETDVQVRPSQPGGEGRPVPA
jgi:bifunctional DNase/RNase